MDVIRFRWKKSYFSNIKNPKILDFVYPPLSWDNKWKSIRGKKEKFLFSSTIFVFLTDLWHLCKFLMLMFFCVAISLYEPIIVWYFDFIIYYTIYGIVFELFYSKILIKNK
jgi:hypothetical protein